MKTANDAKNLVNLGAMECAASCLLSGLRLRGLDEQPLLLDYWNLVYYAQTLLSGRNVRLLDLECLYGIGLRFLQGGVNELAGLLEEGGMALLICKASRLKYFPRELMEFEASGFEHFILITSVDEHAKVFGVADPIADFTGALSADELYAASVKTDALVFYALTFPSAGSFSPPSPAQMLRRGAQRSLSYYEESSIQGGLRALQLFSEDVAAAAGWEQAQRTKWVRQNNVTLTSITRLRGLIWRSFCSLGVMNPVEMKEGGRRIEEIVRNWTLANFMLMKFGVRPELAATLQTILGNIAAEEVEFLRYLSSLGGGTDGL